MTEVKAASFTAREVPWMKLGKQIEGPVTAAEAAKLGGLDFTVSLHELYYGVPVINHNDDRIATKYTEITRRKAIVRDDTGDFFGTASSNVYTPVQYSEAFAFMDTVGSRYVAAGALRGGRQGFIVVKPDIEFTPLNGEDPHDLYAILRTSHDLSRGIEVCVMPLRHRCMNQLSLRTFSKGAQQRWSFKHTTNVHANIAQAKESIARISAYAERYESLASQLAQIEVKPAAARRALEIVIPRPTRGKTDRTTELWQTKIETIMNLWSTSPTIAYAGTGWGLVNAVSEYWEWHRKGGNPESQLIGVMEGDTHKRLNKITGVLLSNA